MSEKWLNEKLDILEENEVLPEFLPSYILDNINPKYVLRPYQENALKRFIYYHNSYKNRENNNHLLFEMATGTGKTLLMASIMLNLYERGYRTFIFFVNSTNILEKTRQNFCNSASSKYLFAENIEINSQRVNIRSIDIIQDANKTDINVIFTTIQGLHLSLTNERENAPTFDDFKENPVVLIADEAHHLNSDTKSQKDLFESWEKTVNKLMATNSNNHLIEFTATADVNKGAVAEKYKQKRIIKYDISSYSKDGYSKKIFLAHTEGRDIKERIMLSLLLNQYRQEVASRVGISLKPVVLFKSKTIKESYENNKIFNEIIHNLSNEDIENTIGLLARHKDIPIFSQMLKFFQTEKDLSSAHLCERLKLNFSEDKIINANEDKEVEKQQIKLNTLEDSDNKTRAIFAVNKLNEGWDVLNLFDIVKLYTTPSTKDNPPTTQEIQLIGRGARYYPFALDDNQDLYKRKYDKDLSNNLSVLETLHFHSSDDSKFIRSLEKSLKDEGLMETNVVEKPLNLKQEFKDNELYKNGFVVVNSRLKRNKAVIDKQNVDFFGYNESLKKELKNITGNYEISVSLDAAELNNINLNKSFEPKSRKILKVIDIAEHVWKKAINKQKGFHFDEIESSMGLTSMQELKEYIKDNKLILNFPKAMNEKDILTPVNLLKVTLNLLSNIHEKINEYKTEYVGTNPQLKPVKEIFYDKIISIFKTDNILDGKHYESFAQTEFIGTSEELECVKSINDYFINNKNVFKNFWLIRNEKHFAIYEFKDGKGFEPDFLLLLETKENTNIVYQVFMEAKGEHLLDYDAWKVNFMNEFANKYNVQEKIIGNIKLIPVPFYTKSKENEALNILEKSF